MLFMFTVKFWTTTDRTDTQQANAPNRYHITNGGRPGPHTLLERGRWSIRRRRAAAQPGFFMIHIWTELWMPAASPIAGSQRP